MASPRKEPEAPPAKTEPFEPGAGEEDEGPSLIERLTALEEKVGNAPEQPNFEAIVKSTIRTMLEGDSLDTIAAKVAERIEGLLTAVNAAGEDAGSSAFVLDELHELRGLIDNTINGVEKSIGTRINRKVAPRIPPDEPAAAEA